MNKNVIIAVVVIAVAVIALPIGLSVMKKGQQEGAASEQATSSGSATTAPAAPAGVPGLTAATLTGSQWNVTIPGVPLPIKVALNSGGQAVATIDNPALQDMMRKANGGKYPVQGKWSVIGDKLKVSVMIDGKPKVIDPDIRGQKLFFQGKEIPRVK